MGKTLKRQRQKQAKIAAQKALTTPNLNDKKLIVKIDAQIQLQRWDKVLELLEKMLDAKQQPKLGTFMRWIRSFDSAGNVDLTMKLYNIILRIVGWEEEENYVQEVWDPFQPVSQSTIDWSEIGENHFEGKHFTIPTEKSQGTVMTYPPNTFKWSSTLTPDVLPVPFVPGSFVLRNVFDEKECAQFIQACKTMGFRGDVDYSFGFQRDSTARLDARPAEGCFWLIDSTIMDVVYERVKPLLPAEVDGKPLAGINARWRFYRYEPGSIYRPHIDGSWPGSGLDKDGKYVFDAFEDRWSCFTFLIYLNDDFEGGSTTYYTPCKGQLLNSRGVKPRTGNILVFPHGTINAALHEGSKVISGCKYVMRSDVLYMK